MSDTSWAGPQDTAGPQPRFEEEEELDLREWWGTILEFKWWILAIALAAILLGVFYIWVAPPTYRTHALIEIEQQGTNRGNISSFAELNALMSGSQQPTATQQEIIKSRSLAETVVQDLDLHIKASPKYFPVIGQAIARRHNENGVAEAPLGLDSYAWGGERIKIGRLEVTESLEGRPLILVAEEGGSFSLYGHEEQKLISGQVGQAASNDALTIFVTELRARPGTEFQVMKQGVPQAAQGLSHDLNVSEKGRQTGVLEVSLEGSSPQRLAAVINTLANNYLRQNVERRSEEAEKRLEFLNTQFPRLKEELAEAEEALKTHQEKTGSVGDLSVEAEEILSQLTAVEQEISTLKLQRTELAQRYTSEHPRYIAVQNKLAELNRRRQEIERELEKLPETEREAIGLQRDVQVANELYISLLNTAQELKIAKAGTIGTVRILDEALVPNNPVAPQSLRILILTMILGLLGGIAAAFIRKALRTTIQNPDVVEDRIGIPVYAVIPHSKKQDKLAAEAKKRVETADPAVLAHAEPKDSATESLRSLRTSLQFASMDTKNNIVAISGPTPGVGKSFVAENLAALLGAAQQKTLLIDGDLRLGHIHKSLGLDSSPGLTDAISGGDTLEAAIKTVPALNIDFLPCGTTAPNPSELLSSSRFSEVMKAVSDQYDLVVIDTPPIVNIADGILIAKQAGTNFLVVRGGTNTLHDISLSVRRYQQNGIHIAGIIFNDFKMTAAKYAYGGYQYYGYQYERDKSRSLRAIFSR